MDEDLIVVDDEAGPSTAGHALPSSSGLQSFNNPAAFPSIDGSERATRSSTSKSKLQPKLKLKLSEKAAAQAPGMSFLGQYDRELDSDDDDLLFEEQFILRMPPGEDLERLKKMVAAREVNNDVWFKFKGAYDLFAFPMSLGLISRETLVGLLSILETPRTLPNSSTSLVSLNPRKRWIASKCSKSQTYVRLPCHHWGITRVADLSQDACG